MSQAAAAYCYYCGEPLAVVNPPAKLPITEGPLLCEACAVERYSDLFNLIRDPEDE